ncbi:MAG: hypothetical protein IH840_02140 [Candidatus Heimdallarchaeota archaeon]|nr:hypothetical protein [Candidatus Heimdallarchaeota archaeon]
MIQKVTSSLIKFTCDIQFEWFDRIGVDVNKLFADQKVKHLNLMAMENCFCEISKYLKVFYFEGRPRNRWKPKLKISKNLEYWFDV